MNEAIIHNWNDVVQNEDEVYHLGDFCFRGPNDAEAFVSRLKGKKYLIRGNHDHNPVVKRLTKHFIWIKDVYLLTVQDFNPRAPKISSSVYRGTNQMIWLSHYPHLSWPSQHYGVWHLFGHSLGKSITASTALAIDVGVDCWNFTPISYEQIKQVMLTEKEYPPQI
jgi:calcineurin-like phosphoesterase family protein